MPKRLGAPHPHKRVLFISHGHPHLMAGGAEVYAYELYQGMKGSRFEPYLLARTRPPAHLGTPFRAIGDDPRQTLMATDGYDYFYGTLPDKLPYIVYLRDYLQHVRPDIVHFQHTLHLGFDCIQMVRRTLPDAGIVYTLHEFIPICNANGQMIRVQSGARCNRASPDRCHECFPDIAPSRFFMRERFIKAHLDLVDLFHAPSQQLLEKYVDWGIPRDRMTMLEYGRQVHDPVAHRPAENGLRNRFGFFGQMNYYKGILVLLRAVNILRKRGFMDFSLVINGANLDMQSESFQKEFQELTHKCTSLVTVAGPYQAEELPQRMAAVDWTIIPSIWWENSPLVIQEAFMHRRPILASNIGGMAEKVTDDRDGLHFQAGNPADLADTIFRAATETKLWDRLVAGIQPVYPVSEAVQIHEQWYDQLLSSPKTAQQATA